MTLPKPDVVDLDTWNNAVAEQRKREDALGEQIAKVNAARKRLPMTPLEGDFNFTDASGEHSLVDLFQGKHQLVVYHFMYGPEWKKGCPLCTRYMSELGNDFAGYIEGRDARFVLVSRAPIETLNAWAAEKGIAAPWYSGSTEFSQATDAIDGDNDMGGFSVLFRDDDNNIYRTYKPDFSGEIPVTGDLVLQLTPYGRQVTDDEVPEGWPQPFSVY